jgi:hypothetical protein
MSEQFEGEPLKIPAPEGFDAYLDEKGEVVLVPKVTQEQQLHHYTEQTPIQARMRFTIEADGPLDQMPGMQHLNLGQLQSAGFIPTSQPSAPFEALIQAQNSNQFEQVESSAPHSEPEEDDTEKQPIPRTSKRIVVLGMVASAAVFAGIIFNTANIDAADKDIQECTGDAVIATVLEELPCFTENFAARFSMDSLLNLSSEDTK